MTTANDTLVLLDPILLANLHGSGWRGRMNSSVSYFLGVAEPVRLDHCPSDLRPDLNAALLLPPVRRVLLTNVTALGELEAVQRYFSYEERVLLAIARTEGYAVASEGSVFRREARKLLPSEKLLSRSELIGLTGLTFEREHERPLLPAALTERTALAHLWKAWGDAGDAATKEAHARLKAQGIGVIVKRDGVVIEEQSDGTIRPLHAKRRT
jgi:hypothetical protein